MDVKEVSKTKRRLEDTICTLLREFERETGTRVDSVLIYRAIAVSERNVSEIIDVGTEVTIQS